MKWLKCVAILVALAGCKVGQLTNETAGPTLSFSSQKRSDTITSLLVDADSVGATIFYARADDNGGVKDIALTFPSKVESCTTVSGADHSGGAFLYAPVPGGRSATASPDDMGAVTSELVIASTFQGPFTCSIPGVTETARPYGDTITATLTATNYSGKTSTATLPIMFSKRP